MYCRLLFLSNYKCHGFRTCSQFIPVYKQDTADSALFSHYLFLCHGGMVIQKFQRDTDSKNILPTSSNSFSPGSNSISLHSFSGPRRTFFFAAGHCISRRCSHLGQRSLSKGRHKRGLSHEPGMVRNLRAPDRITCLFPD